MSRHLVFFMSLLWFAASGAAMVWRDDWGHAIALFALGVVYAIVGACVGDDPPPSGAT